MQDAQQALKVGRDPRMLPEYEALRAEINKLSHASRPEVDWRRVHDMATSIFEKQGVDLQTAIYFTLARSRLAGLNGFTESCEFLANLIVTQWDNFWPPVHQERARIEMLDWFIARISEVIRQYPISHEHKRLVYRCERALQLMSEKLHNSGLSRIPRVENLLHFIEGYTHLFDETEIVVVSDDQSLQKQDMQIPPMVFFHSDMESGAALGDGAEGSGQPALPAGSILVGREKGQMKPTVLKIETHRKQKPAWFWFVCGLLSCALPVAAIAGWQYWQQQKTAALALLQQPAYALPTAADHNDIRRVRIVLGEQQLQGMEGELINRYQAQLEQVKNASPFFLYQYGEGLQGVMRQLYPDSLAVKEMERQWRLALDRQQGDKPRAEGYEQAQARVDDTLRQLLEIERQRRTVTISYLKSKLYDMQKDLLADVPFSLRLRALEERKRASQPPTPAELRNMEDELRAFNIRLYRLQQGDSGS
ncbi:VasL domain-containing protein [Brenneria tiliae]|uniref:Type VI secretion system ImpA family N-terminal domain-containing protein n=1 Tax=Brenneria tiliae TaxID=2914984 RepID=A0ABT0MP13_9GAMM|nr:VasL domain-containing protein [Brenneria tiliae]MCL2891584.1 type VI secretion system ImpA family N-terminal domain-containing protein [Brenneria tiliae]